MRTSRPMTGASTAARGIASSLALYAPETTPAAAGSEMSCKGLTYRGTPSEQPLLSDGALVRQTGPLTFGRCSSGSAALRTPLCQSGEVGDALRRIGSPPGELEDGGPVLTGVVRCGPVIRSPDVAPMQPQQPPSLEGASGR